MSFKSHVPQRFAQIFDEAAAQFRKKTTIQVRNKVPPTHEIPIADPAHWLKIPDVICVFADMKNSTKLSAGGHPSTTAASYKLFTDTGVRIFHELNASYIDIKGDGVFAIFDSDKAHRALAGAVTFKTFATEVFIPLVKETTNVDIGIHIGIDQKTVLVRKIGLKRVDERSDRQNEVWAGKPVNMAAKLASLSLENEIIVSERFFSSIKSEKAKYSCGCPSGEKKSLWSSLNVADDGRFDFSTAHVLRSSWCKKHGEEFCNHLISADSND